MNRAEQDCLVRVRMQCRLTFTTSLRVGSGDHYNLSLDNPKISKPEADAAQDNLARPFCLDQNGVPYVPASTLRGALAARFAVLARSQPGWETGEHEALFGCARRADEAGDYGHMGALRVYDARLSSQDIDYEKRVRMEVNPITRTANDHNLFADLTLPAGSVFVADIEVDRVPAALAQRLADCIGSFAGRTGEQLGAGKNLDRGRVEMSVDKCEAVDAARFLRWLDEDTALDDCYQPLELKASALDVDRERVALGLTFLPVSPLLPIDHAQTYSTGNGRNNTLYYTRRGDQFVIAASTVKGVFRHHCRRILLTKLQTREGCIDRTAQRVADRLLGEVFGDRHQKGVLGFSDWAASLSHGRDRQSGYEEDHEQTMVAIDRFTGGGHDGKLFSVVACLPAEVSGKIFVSRALIDADTTPGWICGLAAFAARSMMIHGVAFGWGRSRGFGKGTIRLEGRTNLKLDTWAKVLVHLREVHADADATLKTWADALDTALIARRRKFEEKAQIA